MTMTPTRTAGLERLAAFTPKASRYAAMRNYDLPGHPHVSGLSPYIRHRLVTEEEVLETVLARYAPSTVEKFTQEVFWRTYWKGWLELRPSIWPLYRSGVKAALDRVATEAGLRRDWETACRGETGIDAFDHWARDLVETGYLHNHARMWFASIWIFTLRLPWELGADFFLRHLLDGDAAANTLSWRWVAGLQTPGKTYAARASNIAKYTEGRFRPQGLEPSPVPLDGTPHPPKGDAPVSDALDPDLPTGFLLHEDDLSPGFALDRVTPTATFVLKATAARSPLEVAPIVHDFVDGALDDCLARFKDRLGPVTVSADGAAITDWAAKHGCRQIVLAYPPTGPIADRMGAAQPALENAGLPLVRLIRPYDALAWPHATAGFFKFKAKIPHLISDLNLRPAA